MKMSASYMRDTVAHLGSRGFAVQESTANYGEPATGAQGTRFELTRDREKLILETVVHPTEGESYYLEIVQFHGLRSFSFPLDSWKFRPDRIEFKYYALPDDGRGLSLTLELPPS